jgi:hypothetical protein
MDGNWPFEYRSFFPSGDIAGCLPDAVPITVGVGASELAAKTVDVLSAHVAKTTRPFNVQSGALSGAGVFVILFSSPPSGLVTYTSYVPSRLEINAMASPRGDTDGSPPLMTGLLGC